MPQGNLPLALEDQATMERVPDTSLLRAHKDWAALLRLDDGCCA
jgi:hypothetical protein